jgi:hemerythrin superfamily protein
MTSIRDAFHQDHQRLDAVFDELSNRMRANDVPAAREAWTVFEAGLLAHFEAEEKHMIPTFAKRDPVEAASLLADHAKLRSLLADLGVMLDLHALRDEKVTELVAFLRAHAAREEAALYRWSDGDLDEAPKASLVERLHEAGQHASARARKLADEIGSSLL